MFQNVVGHAIATKVIMVNGTEVQMYKCSNGAILGLDGSFLVDNDEGELYITSPYEEGAIQLCDSVSDKSSSKICGDEHDDTLLDKVTDQIKIDLSNGDMSAIEELLNFLPKKLLEEYIQNTILV